MWTTAPRPTNSSVGAMFKDIRAQYRASLKSLDTEEHIDLAFYRPIGFAWAMLCKKLGITPNAVTIASIFIGIGAGICFYPADYVINICGILLLIWANSLDSADGQLARLTGQYSRLGRILDGMAGDMWFISIYIAICLRTNHTDAFFAQRHALIWVMAAVAGLCHARQAALADYFRQFHLRFVKKSFPSELESAAKLRRQYHAMPWRKFFPKIALFFYSRYTEFQEKTTPQMQRLMVVLSERYPDGKLPDGVAEQLRVATLPLCKWENFMTFNWRSIFLFVTVLIGQPWIYFALELTLFNIVYVVTNHRHESICRQALAGMK